MSKSLRLTEEEYRALKKRNPRYERLITEAKLKREIAGMKALSDRFANPHRKSKYNAQRTVVDGITFASKKEAKRYAELKLMEKAGRIQNLQRQVRFDLKVNGVQICHYIADFTYGDPLFCVEDTKGYRTPIYKLKKTLMLALRGITIRET